MNIAFNTEATHPKDDKSAVGYLKNRPSILHHLNDGTVKNGEESGACYSWPRWFLAPEPSFVFSIVIQHSKAPENVHATI